MSEFLTLVKNDLDIAGNYKKHNTFWSRLYMILALLCGIIIYTMLLISQKITPYFISLVPAFLLFTPFPQALGLIKREWQANTVGWWLQLPCSRRILLGAKFTAGFIRFIKVVFIVLVISVLLWSEGMILLPSLWNMNSLVAVTVQLCKMYIQIISISPLLIVFGMLLAVLQNTRFRHAAPISWAIYGGIMSIFFITFFKTEFHAESGFTWVTAIPGISYGMTFAIGIIAIFAVTVLMFLFAAFLLERYVEV